MARKATLFYKSLINRLFSSWLVDFLVCEPVKVTQFSGRYLGGVDVVFVTLSPLKNEGLAKYIVRCSAATVASITLPFVEVMKDDTLMIYLNL